MALGIAVYVLYRRNQRLPLTETVKVVTPEPLGVEEVEYRSVLVGFEDGEAFVVIEYRSVLVAFEDDEPFSAEMVATAVKLASKRRRGIHVHSMLTVPTNLPLDAEMPEQEAEAQSKIEEAKLIGGQRVTGHVARVRPGQAGLLDLRRGGGERGRAAIVVGLRYRDGVPLYDKTLQTVLGERPCRVIVVSDPAEQVRRRPPAAAVAEATGCTLSASTAARSVGFSLVFVAIGLLCPGRHPRQRRRPALGRLPAGLAFLAVGAGRLWLGSRVGG